MSHPIPRADGSFLFTLWGDTIVPTARPTTSAAFEPTAEPTAPAPATTTIERAVRDLVAGALAARPDCIASAYKEPTQGEGFVPEVIIKLFPGGLVSVTKQQGRRP